MENVKPPKYTVAQLVQENGTESDKYNEKFVDAFKQHSDEMQELGKLIKTVEKCHKKVARLSKELDLYQKAAHIRASRARICHVLAEIDHRFVDVTYIARGEEDPQKYLMGKMYWDLVSILSCSIIQT